MSEYVECYENLKAAVVKLAADDYRRALIRLTLKGYECASYKN